MFIVILRCIFILNIFCTCFCCFWKTKFLGYHFTSSSCPRETVKSNLSTDYPLFLVFQSSSILHLPTSDILTFSYWLVCMCAFLYLIACQYFLHYYKTSHRVFDSRVSGIENLRLAFGKSCRNLLALNLPLRPKPIFYQIYLILFYLNHECMINSVLTEKM